jgi:predicted aspartyl protease
MQPSRSFTSRYEGLSKTLMNQVGVSVAFDPKSTPPSEQPVAKEYRALWDTGATMTVITQGVVDNLGLKATGMVTLRHADGETQACTYIVNFSLPNRVHILGLPVVQCDLEGTDVLVGMDIIGMGDFAVTNWNGRTMFSYRVPSIAPIDFTGKVVAQSLPSAKEPPKNSKCPCGSGRKYKNCCGAGI